MDNERPAVEAGSDPGALSAGTQASGGGLAVAPDVLTVQGTPTGTSAGRTDLVLAGFWRRAAAAAMDTVFLATEVVLLSFVVLVITVIVAMTAAGGREVPAEQAPLVQMAIAIVILQVIFSWLYSAVLQSSAWQATLGMRLAGLEVTDLQGRRLSFARATARYAAKRLVVLTLFLGFLVIVVTDRRQALHDVMAGTLVVRRREAAAEGPAGAADVFDADQVRRALDRAFVISRDRLPADLHARVAVIRLKILELLPDAERFPTGSRDVFVLHRTATDYLPTSIEAYLALPQSYATTSVLPGGKTALQVLGDQLELLDWKMDEIGDAFRQLDSERLLAHGRFLEESFGRQSEDLSLPPSRP